MKSALGMTLSEHSSTFSQSSVILAVAFTFVRNNQVFLFKKSYIIVLSMYINNRLVNRLEVLSHFKIKWIGSQQAYLFQIDKNLVLLIVYHKHERIVLKL